ncbi:hypothetical protein PO878_18050 [Iamia majanohamensis]|uniref:Uncharacterized protein n=1 Tax=Iamia majanohamensis TaxID=467976 RepID=A0AAE9Y8R0_9ACTN|nr:hypothetical protein [Iamia majanohamensis]WCO66404.1 hypothetical protein PO878_18050 [Iamia majanohamensis]
MPAPSSTALVVGVLRAVWLVLPLAVGPVLAAALDDRSAPVRDVASVLAWATWVVVLVALLVPRATSLTVARIGVPAALVAAGWAAGPGQADPDVLGGALAVVAAAVATALCLAPVVGDAFVTGSAYGTERRFALRCPPALAALAVATWAVVVAGIAAGPLLLAARQWVLGGVALVLGLAVAAVGARSLHQLSRRWLVFVPSGVVVHDPVGRPDAVMAPRPLIEGLGPEPADDEALDLTLGASGLSLVLVTSETLPVTVRRGRQDLGTEAAHRVAFTPGRPGAVLAEADARRIPLPPA